MKISILLFLTILFFIVINTSFLWEESVVIWMVPIFMTMVGLFCVLILSLLYHLVIAVKERLRNKKRVILICFMTLVLSLACAYPMGFTRPELFADKPLLTAGREGAANCNSSLSLMPDNTFVFTEVCFGVERTKGKYRIAGDTIFFDVKSLPRNDTVFYKYAIVKKDIVLPLFKSDKDTMPDILWITQNDLTP